MAYEPKGEIKQKKVKGKQRFVDTWKEDGKKKTHTLSIAEETEWQNTATPEQEITPVQAEVVKAEVVPEIKKEILPYNVHGQAIEIFGNVTKMDYTTDNEAVVTIQSVDGQHTEECMVDSRTLLGTIFQHADAHKDLDWKDFWGRKATRNKLTKMVIQKEAKTMFRINSDNNTVFGVLTNRWTKVTIDDLEPFLKQAANEMNSEDIDLVSSNGLHGGTARITFPGAHSDVLQASVFITAGNLNGLSSLRMWGEMKVLACSNQLTAAVSDKIRPIVGSSFQLRKVHAGKPMDLVAAIQQALANVEMMHEAWQKSKEIKVDLEKAGKILGYYSSRAIISKRTAENSLALFQDEEISQVPETLWGLAMAVSWLGTHGDVKDGVRTYLKSLGGELICVAPHWQEYTKLVNGIVA